MGISISRYADLSNNEFLVRLCSPEVLVPNNPFWNQLLTFNINPPKNSQEQLMFDSSVETLLQTILVNNPKTGNLGSLVQVFMTRATELLASPNTDNTMLAWQTFNALFVIRVVTKYLIETIPEYQVLTHFDVQVDLENVTVHLGLGVSEDGTEEEKVEIDIETEVREVVIPPPSNPTPQNELQSTEQASTLQASDTEAPKPVQSSPKLNANESRMEMIIDALVGLIIDVPITDNTYYLHLECINTILVLMSVYSFAGSPGQLRLVETSLIFRTLFHGRYSMHASLLVRTLLKNFSTMYIAPEHIFGYNPSGGSLVLGLASGIWNMLTLSSSTPVKHSLYSQPPVDSQELSRRLLHDHPVANQSCLLLLALTNHCINKDNLYRKALLSCEDSTETTSTTPSRDTTTNPISEITPPRIEMNMIHKALCTTAGCEHTTLLLYLLLHSCKAYKKHVCSAPNIEHLILPILQSLYKAPDNNCHHIYMSLIVLLILTEDDSLIKSVHQINLKNLTWYTERAISEISLGGMMVLVIIRTVQYNILRVRDKYLHTNCLAALANMSSEFRNLHPYVSQRLISLFETLSKRRDKLLQELQEKETTLLIPEEEHVDDAYEHTVVLEEVLIMVLEILNSCLTNQLPNNLNLVYALLYKRDIFKNYKHEAAFHNIIQNIEMVIGYFTSRLTRVQDSSASDLSVTEVLQCLKKGAEQWTSDRLKKFPELKFRYVEEDKPEEFFTPYVWSLVISCGAVYWS